MIDIDEFISENLNSVMQLIKQLAVIPSPTGMEREKALFCKNFLQSNGVTDVLIDEADNVICKINCENGRQNIVFMAHTDTVFPITQELTLIEESDILRCPGIGDNTANLAIMLWCVLYLHKCEINSDYGFIFAATSGEEGCGNLKGSRKLFEDYGKTVREAIAFDLYLDSLIYEAVGSERYRITSRTDGGHAYSDFGKPNAIERISRIVSELYDLSLPKASGFHTTQNVGMITGGTSINTLASEASILYEYRSNNHVFLEIMRENLNAIIERYRLFGDVSAELIGVRPVGINCNKKKQNALLERLLNAYVNVLPLPKLKSGSTDINIPLSMGIPAVCCGLVLGGGEHTTQEYIIKSSVQKGMKTALNIIKSYSSQ